MYLARKFPKEIPDIKEKFSIIQNLLQESTGSIQMNKLNSEKNGLMALEDHERLHGNVCNILPISERYGKFFC